MLVHLTLLSMSLILSTFDWRDQSFPLWIWGITCFPLFFLTSFNWLVACFLLVALLAEMIDLKIGSGDFLYLASLSFAFSFSQLLWVIQIASWLALVSFLIIKPKEKMIAFLPFLSLGYIAVLLTTYIV